MLRAANDTNVWVSAINWPQGKPRRLFDLLRSHVYAHVTSLEILFEITRVLRVYFGFSDEDAYAWYRGIGGLSKVVRPIKRLDVVKNDPTDNKFIECAVAGRCDFVVSGDRHLLDLERHADILIIPVAEFLDRLTGERS